MSDWLKTGARMSKHKLIITHLCFTIDQRNDISFLISHVPHLQSNIKKYIHLLIVEIDFPLVIFACH